MPQCVVVDGSTGALAASAADPCTTFVVLSPTEYASLNNSPLNLSPEDGLALTVAILSVWATAFAFRALVRTLNVSDGGTALDP